VSPDGVANVTALTGTVVLVTMVDFETRTLYAMQITFVENVRAGVPRLSVTDTLYLVVDNGNEAPIFTSSPVAFVLENLPFGSAVFTVTTSDEFNPIDGVTYAMIGGTFSKYFRLSTTGVLTTTYIFDYEDDDPLNGTLIITVWQPHGHAYALLSPSGSFFHITSCWYSDDLRSCCCHSSCRLSMMCYASRITLFHPPPTPFTYTLWWLQATDVPEFPPAITVQTTVMVQIINANVSGPRWRSCNKFTEGPVTPVSAPQWHFQKLHSLPRPHQCIVRVLPFTVLPCVPPRTPWL
jgi:hypothetical protein